MFKFYLNRILNLVFPPICLVCRCKLKDSGLHQGVLCDMCFKKIEPNPPPHCIKCGASLSGRYDLKTICNRCKDSPDYFTKAKSPYLYEGVMKECIYLLKYKTRPKILKVVKELLIPPNADSILHIEADIIIPVPLHKARLRHRGFNQAELLSRLIEWDNPSKIRTDILRRIKPTVEQSKLNTPHQKIANVRGAFNVHRADIVKDKDILLVDDVFTTGATSNECARVLFKAGAKNVYVWTLLRTRVRPEV